jgi:signal transduction histidine kinase
VKSIARSLTFYFLLLLAVALGSVSILAYKSIERILEKEQVARREVLYFHFEDQKRREERVLDRTLRTQATLLAAQAQFQWSRAGDLRLLPLNALAMASNHSSVLVAPIWLTEKGRGYLRGLLLTKITFNEESSRLGEGQINEYFQINSETGAVWRSRSMAGRSFPVSSEAIETAELGQAHFDDMKIEPGVLVRRISLKVPVAKETFAPPRGSRISQRAGSGRQQAFERVTPAIFIQCAAETTERDAAIAVHRAQLVDELQNLQKESKETLARVERWIWIIGLGTFAALFGGCLWLVRAGLSPLRRLSVAVGRVSPQDFRLPMEEKGLPNELKPIVERLSGTFDLLQNAFEREKHAAADISHELRTPLAALLTTLEVGLRRNRSVEEYRQLMADCLGIGERMSQLVERLLTLARLDAGVDSVRPTRVDVSNLAQECAELVRPLAHARDLTLEIRQPGPLPVRTDPEKLREILTNLLHNAVEYNRPKGRVELLVSRDNGRVEFEVRDTGVGIPAEKCQHIFERFYRADESRHSNGGLHAGLGLSIVKGYVDLLGGTIDVNSVKDQGTTFRVEIPSLPT